MSPNPLAGAAAWSAAVLVDLLALAGATAVLGWDRWCPPGTSTCPAASSDRTARDAAVLAALGGVLAAVAVVALLRGRWLLVVFQLVLVVGVALAAARADPAAFDHLRTQLHLGITAPRIASGPRTGVG